MKVKIEISICTGLMLNDHSNPYIESTTVFSDNINIIYIYKYIIITRARLLAKSTSHEINSRKINSCFLPKARLNAASFRSIKARLYECLCLLGKSTYIIGNT